MRRTSVVFEKSALHPVCQQTAATAIKAGAAATSPAARGVVCSGPEQGGFLPVISTSSRRFIGSGVYSKSLKEQIFSSLELAEGRRAPPGFSLLPGRNRANSSHRGTRRRFQNRAGRGAGQGETGEPGGARAVHRCAPFDPIPSRSKARAGLAERAGVGVEPGRSNRRMAFVAELPHCRTIFLRLVRQPQTVVP